MQFETEDTSKKSNTITKAKETEIKAKELKEKIEIKEEPELKPVSLPSDFKRVDIENDIKTIFLSGNPEKVNIITETLKQYGVLKIQKLTDEQIYMLHKAIIKLHFL